MDAPSYTYTATLDRVIDGDTVVLNIDLGFRLTAKLPIRLLGLNCPEHGTPGGNVATAYTLAWFAGRTLTVTTQKNPEKYGRWLGIISAAGGSTLNADLIASHNALAWDGKGGRPLPPVTVLPSPPTT